MAALTCDRVDEDGAEAVAAACPTMSRRDSLDAIEPLKLACSRPTRCRRQRCHRDRGADLVISDRIANLDAVLARLPTADDFPDPRGSGDCDSPMGGPSGCRLASGLQAVGLGEAA